MNGTVTPEDKGAVPIALACGMIQRKGVVRGSGKSIR